MKTFAKNLFVLFAVLTMGIMAACGGGGGGGDGDNGNPTPVPNTETTYLNLVSTDPADNTAGIDVKSVISATFDKDIEGSTIISNMIVTEKATGIIVAGVASANGKMATFTPSANLRYETVYEVSLKKGISATGGALKLSADFNFSFTTAENMAGRLDPAFGTDGKVTTPFNLDSYSGAYAVAVQADGKIIVAGDTGSDYGETSEFEFALARYNGDGTLDATFGIGGRVTTAIGLNSYNSINSVTVQPDGKIVAAGVSGDICCNLYFALVRYNSNGTLDSTFGMGGKVTTAIGSDSWASASAVAIQTDGKIVAAGSAHNGTDMDFALVRYNINGSLDTAFGICGIATNAFKSESRDTIKSMAIQPDGKIVTAGYVEYYFNGNRYEEIALARYNNDGSLDTAFGIDGKVTTPIESEYAHANSVAVQPDGKIVVAGGTWSYNTSDFVLVKYISNGSPDASFGTGGVVKTAIDTDTCDEAYSVALQQDGKIVAAGYSLASDNISRTLALARYNSNGSLDTSFDADGKVKTPIGSGTYDAATSIVIQPDGKIVAAGLSYNDTDKSCVFALVRYLP